MTYWWTSVSYLVDLRSLLIDLFFVTASGNSYLDTGSLFSLQEITFQMRCKKPPFGFFKVSDSPCLIIVKI